MAITKEMLARCQNELKQAFCALPEDVQTAILRNAAHAELIQSNGAWRGCFCSGCKDVVYRLSPDTPTELEWEEAIVFKNDHGYYKVNSISRGSIFLTSCLDCDRVLGIIYLKDGTETLRTSVDAAFGVPVRVRFSK